LYMSGKEWQGDCIVLYFNRRKRKTNFWLGVRLITYILRSCESVSWAIHVRVSITAGCKLDKCWGGGERRGERGETDYKLTADLETQEPRNSVRETSGPCINSEKLTTIWVGWEKAANKSHNHQTTVLLTLLLWAIR
jgi:hypothetical protein